MNGQLFAAIGLLVLCHFAQGRGSETTWVVLFGMAGALGGFGARKALEHRWARKVRRAQK
jgi:hypothetical protein